MDWMQHIIVFDQILVTSIILHDQIMFRSCWATFPEVFSNLMEQTKLLLIDEWCALDGTSYWAWQATNLNVFHRADHCLRKMRYCGIATLQVPNKRHIVIRESRIGLLMLQGEFYDNCCDSWILKSLFFINGFPLKFLLNYHPLSENQMFIYGGTSLSCKHHFKSHVVSLSKVPITPETVYLKYCCCDEL